ncbi:MULTISPECIES: ferrochelatase [Campylobacter]|uniref:Ferrochelatase n=1 Tax=Campylobacter vicugnae TaxID=1660076 RepID=A0ABZ2E5Z2_9BACT|nr:MULTISPECIES: ferrochelatase [unclassified Campylobacter]ARR04188.1 ferrochelatase [Campylobacter sp. RM12175]MCR8690141.1 ferrochelatase [Campylobacter sp. RM9264]MCR8700753.1 ferrochelatase [Campylobacter sp. RM12176]
MKRVVILLNMGGVDNLSQVRVFLTNMFNDPYILGIKNRHLRAFVAWMITMMRLKPATQNYIQLGGKSALGDITRSLVAKLNSKFGFDNLIFDYAMNYTPPFASDTLAKYKDADEIVLFPLYPHHSVTTITSSLDSAKRAIGNLDIKAKIKVVDYFYKNSKFNDIIVSHIAKSLGDDDASKIDLIFSAHSLPQKVIDSGDLYEKHLNEHLEILKSNLNNCGLRFNSVSLAYQSRLGPVKWLGPNLSEVLPSLSSKRAMIYPISFCIDNSETDFELAIEYKHIADDNKFSYYKVVKALNDSDEFISFIAQNI